MTIRVGVVTALAAEAQALFANASVANGPRSGASITVVRWDGLEVGCLVSGMGRARAYTAALRLIEAGAVVLLSAGVAGGLDPRLSSGDALLAERILRIGDGGVVTGDWRAIRPAHPVTSSEDRHRARRCRGSNPGRSIPVTEPNSGLLACVDRPLLKACDKAALHGRTRALAVDMESAGVALAAYEAAVPVAALKVISDAADRELPKAVASVIDARGQLRSAAVIAQLARTPALIPLVAELARDFNRARETLNAIGLPLVAALARECGDSI